MNNKNHLTVEKNPHLSVVIPVYQAANCLQELYVRLKRSLETISPNFEIVLIDDCSRDNSWLKIKELSLEDSRVKGFLFSRNFGQHYGISAGLDRCSGDWVIVMDCDLQDRPEEIPKLYQKALEGFDVVLARRTNRQDSFLKRLNSALFFKVFSYLTDTKHDGTVGNFRIMSSKVVLHYRNLKEHLRYFGGLVQWLGFPTASIDVEHAERFEGNSSYNFAKLWKLSVDIIIAYSDKPLRLTVRFGFVMATLSFFYGLYIILRTLFYGTPIQGWSSLIVSLYFIGGSIISILGILGLYLGKTFDEVKRRPLYVIQSTTVANIGI